MLSQISFFIENMKIITVISTFAGLSFLYFGKIITDKWSYQYERLDQYIHGSYFTIWYIFMPLMLSYGFIKQGTRLSLRWSVVIQILIFMIISWASTPFVVKKKYGLEMEFKKRFQKKFDNLKKTKSFLGWAANQETNFKKWIGVNAYELNRKVLYDIPYKLFKKPVLLFFSSIVTSVSFLSIIQKADILLSIIFIVITFYIFTSTAVLYGYIKAYYPKVRVVFDDDQILEGILIKSFKDSLLVFKNKKKIYINRNKINFLEMDLLKNNK